jgi:ketosteroid isomerase-like protein
VWGKNRKRGGRSMKKLGSSSLYAVAAVALLVCGCAMFGSGPSDEQLIGNTLAEWKAGLVEEDIDRFLATFSEDFSSSQGGGKAEIGDFIGGAMEQGYLEDVEVNVEDADIAVEGDTATASPVELDGVFGVMTFGVTLKKENGTWRIIGMEEA